MNVQLITFHGVINFWNDNYWYYFRNHNQCFFVVKSCPDPGRPENGDRYYQDRYFRVGSTVRFSCQSGFQLSGSKERTCMENKEWNGTLTTCQDGSKWEISQSSLKWNREGQWVFALDWLIYLFFTSCILLALSEDYSVRVVFHSPGIKSPAQVKLGQDKMKTFLNEMVSSVVS